MSFDKSKFKSSVKNITLASPSSIFGQVGEEITFVEIASLQAFQEHPFYVLEDESMEALKQSISEHGVLMPIVVREISDERYEIVAGHRRTRACTLLGLKEIPALVRDISQEEAIFQMVDTNIQREELLPSEKAFAYRMKLEAAKRKVGRKSTVENAVPVGQSGTSGKSFTSRELLAQNTSDSSVQIQRYIRLTYLISELLQYTDEKKLPFQVAVELSYLTKDEQEDLLLLQPTKRFAVTLKQATILKGLSQTSSLTTDAMMKVLEDSPKAEKPVSLALDIAQYFPEKTKKADMEKVILQLLEQWKKTQSGESS